jgi:hypothetical protein
LWLVQPVTGADKVVRRSDIEAPEDDDAVARRLDFVAEDFESVPEAEGGDLAFDQSFDRLRQRLLRFANANRERAAFGLAGLDQELAKKV